MKKIIFATSFILIMAYITGPYFLPEIAKAYLYSLDTESRERHIKSAHAHDKVKEICDGNSEYINCWNKNYARLMAE
jgi:hypothetical protein